MKNRRSMRPSTISNCSSIRLPSSPQDAPNWNVAVEVLILAVGGKERMWASCDPAIRRTDSYRSRIFPIRIRSFDQYVKLHTIAPIDPGIARPTPVWSRLENAAR